MSGRKAEHARAILATVNPEAENVFARQAANDPLRRAIAEELRLRGHDVHEHVGSAAFRCDLAIVDADGGAYALAVLLDSGQFEDDGQVAERYVFRPGILRTFGWRVIDVPSLAWLRDPDAVIAAIESALASDSDVEGDDDPFVDAPAPAVGVKSIIPRSGTAKDKTAAAVEPQRFTELRFTQGSSDKFWKVGVAGCVMTVIYGRIGSKGNTVTKTFESEERARREADKLILEKTRKGYADIS